MSEELKNFVGIVLLDGLLVLPAVGLGAPLWVAWFVFVGIAGTLARLT